jgi:hypothetical protein
MQPQRIVRFDRFRREVIYSSSGSHLIVQSKCRLCGATRTTEKSGLEQWEHEHRCTPEQRQRRRAS